MPFDSLLVFMFELSGFRSGSGLLWVPFRFPTQLWIWFSGSALLSL